ncbi:glycosyl hydrolase [Microlunatus parietis]|uniref:Alpha-L-rhamnosidase n=1 Tax=Microlunatus parietis TaxID=682979 RepID=A0A7Y9L7D3_9ACTN|nr:glycosyl hydrolase [Microlunatus parietis]NYE69659.1 hypothetical protein [Microlunatus parietis]
MPSHDATSRTEFPGRVAELRRGFAEPDPAARPMMRWWWFGPDVEDAEVERELTAMADAGFGGAEVAFVYPLRQVRHPFLSDEFGARLRHAAEFARSLGLRFDLTIGSGWSYGGPHIGPDHVARRLHWERRELTAAAVRVPVVAPWPGDELVAAFLAEGSPGEARSGWVPLSISDSMITIEQGRGPRTVLLAWSRPTGQNVKRAAAGAEGPVLDHYSAAATRKHLAELGDRLLAAVPAELLGSVFCDSLEVYAADWTPDLPAEFARRRGYDPLPHLHRLTVEEAGSAEFRADFYRTLTELAEDNFIAVCRDWAAGHGVPFRLQGYGVPPVTVSSNRHADLIEGEGWGWTELTQTRWASSAGHLYGRPVISSEIWTWVHSPSFRATPLDLKGEAHEHFLLGINQFVGHGWPYSPPDAPGLGWYFYAAGALDDRNPWWPAMPALNAYLTRLGWLLRQGEPVADVKLYLPASDVYPTLGRGLDLWKATRRHIGPELPRTIRCAGYDYDLIDDPALESVDPASVPVVVLPRVTTLPPTARAWLDAVREAGGTVLAVDSTAYPEGVAATVETFEEALRRALPPDAELSGAGDDIGVVHRRLGDGDLYFVANTGSTVRTFDLAPRTERDRFERWDPATGQAEVLAGSRAATLTLHPYQAAVVVATDGADREGDAGERVARSGSAAESPLAGPWRFGYLDAGGVREVVLPHRWEDERPGYSGGAWYELDLDARPDWLDPATELILDFGPADAIDDHDPSRAEIRGNSYRARVEAPVREVAVVSVNGAACGVVWDAPYRLDLTGRFRAGSNTLRIEVYNSAAAAVATDPDAAAIIEESRRLYGVRFHQQDLELALDGVSSGLLRVPSLRSAHA